MRDTKEGFLTCSYNLNERKAFVDLWDDYVVIHSIWISHKHPSAGGNEAHI